MGNKASEHAGSGRAIWHPILKHEQRKLADTLGVSSIGNYQSPLKVIIIPLSEFMIPVQCSTSWAIRTTESWSLSEFTIPVQCSTSWGFRPTGKWVYDTSTVLYQLNYHANRGLVIKWVRDMSTVLYQLSYQANWERVIRWVVDDPWQVESDAQSVWNTHTFCTAEWTTRFDVTMANFERL